MGGGGGGGGGREGKHPQMFNVILYSGNYIHFWKKIIVS